MPKTIVIDKLDLVELRILRNPDDTEKRLQVFARYNLHSGDSLVQAQYRQITMQLSAPLKSNVASLFDSVLANVAASEQV